MTELLPYLMFAALTVFLALGYPVAFTLGGISLAFTAIGLGMDFQLFTLLPLRFWGRMTNFILLSVPLFIFMGVFLEKSGIAEELLDVMADIFGRLRGGVAISIVMVGAVLAASTGIMGATCITMGIISLPQMLKRGYQHELAAGTICASATLGQIIPPSLSLILVADVMGVPVGDIYAGAVIPGLLLVCFYILFLLIYSHFRPRHAPGMSEAEIAQRDIRNLAWRTLRALIPATCLIMAVLGTIFFGVASPTEGAAMGAFGTMVLTVFYRRMTWAVLKEVMYTTTRFCGMAFQIILGATAFGLVFRGLGGDEAIKNLAIQIGGGPWGVIFLSLLLIFLLGFFIDHIEITYIILPLLLPILTHFKIDLLWYCVLVGVNFQTSFLTPPFGFALFFLKGVAPKEVTTAQIYRGVWPWICIQLVGLACVLAYPPLATWLPKVIYQ
jgi:tripartite ATP-independent transporter DctM subunit